MHGQIRFESGYVWTGPKKGRRRNIQICHKDSKGFARSKRAAFYSSFLKGHLHAKPGCKEDEFPILPSNSSNEFTRYSNCTEITAKRIFF